MQEGGEIFPPPPLPDRLVVSPNLLSSGIGKLRRELSSRGLTITDVKNTWCLTGTAPYILMAWAWGLIKHRENFVPGTSVPPYSYAGRGQLKCDGTHAETRFRLSAKRTSSFKSAGALVQSTTGSRSVRISGSNAGYTMFRGSVKGTGYPLY